MPKELFYWLPAALCAALIFWVSHQSQPPAADLVPDYLGHLVAYAGFTLTLAWGKSRGFQARIERRGVLVLGLIAVLYGLSDEFHQSFVPGRVASVGDFLFDVFGVALCLLVLHLARGVMGR